MEQRWFPDPVHRDWIRFEDFEIKISKCFEEDFARLKESPQLGLIALGEPLAQHKKWEHQVGFYYLVRQALEEGVFPSDAQDAVKYAAMVYHLGHCPYHYPTEKAILLAAKASASIRATLTDILEAVRGNVGAKCEDCELESCVESVMADFRWRSLHRWFSAYKVLRNDSATNYLKDQLPEQADKVFEALICRQSEELHGRMARLDKLDFVLRDLHYLTTTRVDFSLSSLLAQLRAAPTAAVPSQIRADEWQLIESFETYLQEQVYHRPDVVACERVFEKTMARALLRGLMTIAGLMEMSEDELKKQVQRWPTVHRVLKHYVFDRASAGAAFYRQHWTLSVVAEDTHRLELERRLAGRRTIGAVLQHPLCHPILVAPKQPPSAERVYDTEVTLFPDASNRSFTKFLTVAQKIEDSSLPQKARPTEKAIFEYLVGQPIRFAQDRAHRALNDILSQEGDGALEMVEILGRSLYSKTERATSAPLRVRLFDALAPLAAMGLEERPPSTQIFKYFLLLRDSLPQGARSRFLRHVDDLATTTLSHLRDHNDASYQGILLEAHTFLDRLASQWDTTRRKWLVANLEPLSPSNEPQNEYDVIELRTDKDRLLHLTILECTAHTQTRELNKCKTKLHTLGDSIIQRFPDIDVRCDVVIYNRNTSQIEHRAFTLQP